MPARSTGILPPMSNDLFPPGQGLPGGRKPIQSLPALLMHLIAWGVIVVIMAFIAFVPLLFQEEEKSGETRSLPINHEMTGRLLLGAKSLGAEGNMLGMQAAPMREGFIEERLAYAILQAELVGPEIGIKELERINVAIDRNEPPHSEATRELAELVGVLLFASAAGEEGDALPPEKKALLEETLGVYGELLHARATGDSATIMKIEAQSRRGVIAFGVLVVWALFSFSVGSILLVVLLIMTVIKRLKVRFSRGPPSGSIYIETFAIWIFLHISLQIVAALSIPESTGTSGMLLASMIAMFLSLGALFWPLIRGVPMSAFRQETGLYAGNVFVEAFAGLATYMMALPLLIVGVVLSLILGVLITFLFGEMPPPEHPIQDAIGGSAMTLVMVYLVACVAAPIVEEIIFRGVLYRYLRDSSRHLGWVVSFLGSALISSFLFAAIHPQGIAFIPILGSLAVAFCIGREWRGSLVAPMVAHAVNNGVVITLNVMLLS